MKIFLALALAIAGSPLLAQAHDHAGPVASRPHQQAAADPGESQPVHCPMMNHGRMGAANSMAGSPHGNMQGRQGTVSGNARKMCPMMDMSTNAPNTPSAPPPDHK